MRKITFNTTGASENSNRAIAEWMRKEHGSFEDHEGHEDHAYATLKRFGGKIELTQIQARNLIESGEYQSTSWQTDEIEGGKVTMQTIARWTAKVKALLPSFMAE